MKRILVSLTALIVAISCMFVFCACNVPTVMPGDNNDVTLGGSGDAPNKDVVTEEGDKEEEGDFDPTDSTVDETAPTLEPDTVPATPGLVFKLNSDEKSYRVFDYFNDDGEPLSTEVYIPYTYEGLPVTGIGYKAFDGVETLADVVLPKTLEYIDAYAFMDCKSLYTIDLPASLKTIGASAFDGCNALSDITVDEENAVYASIGSSLVEKASKTLILGSENSIIPDDGSITAIGDNAFRGKPISTIAIPDCIETIGRAAFADCDDLVAVVLPADLEVIEDSVFLRCVALNEIVIPETVTSIGAYAFEGCRKIADVNVPSSVTEIGGRAFKDCKSMQTISLEEGLTSIGGEAFVGCDLLTEIVLPLSLESIGTMAFRNCTMLKKVSFNPVYKEYEISKTEVGVCLDSKLTYVGNGAFYNCISLESFVLPRATTTLGAYAFQGCTSENLIVYLESSMKLIGWETGWNAGTSAAFIYYSNNQGKNAVWHYVEADGSYEIEIIPKA